MNEVGMILRYYFLMKKFWFKLNLRFIFLHQLQQNKENIDNKEKERQTSAGPATQGSSSKSFTQLFLYKSCVS